MFERDELDSSTNSPPLRCANAGGLGRGRVAQVTSRASDSGAAARLTKLRTLNVV